MLERFQEIKFKHFVATEDGSLGHQGTVIDLFLLKREKLWREGPPYLFQRSIRDAKGLTKALGSKKFLCEASFEARMACGFGACWGCVIKTKDPRNPYQGFVKKGLFSI
jgi:dihydroorotate dehydrogenase electron transfer subunit